MLTTYADINLDDLESVLGDIREKAEFKKNLAGNRVIVKWYGDTPSSIVALGVTTMTCAEIKAYMAIEENGYFDPNAPYPQYPE